jgi:tRNA pseudouridine32 synthase / 23S rRNA pseudouridine746 synthase
MSALEVAILYVDDFLIIANKPSGLLAVPGRGPDKQDCLSARVQRLYPDALIVHRLDMDTSGLICMARGIEAQRSLSSAFAQRRVHKTYIAIAHGILGEVSAHWHSIDLPICVDWPNRPRSKVDLANGKPSLTHWRSLQHDYALSATRVELQPVTGRSHQLRVHLTALGHPILGDPLYMPAAPTKSKAARMLLHAAQLQIPHPSNGEMIEFVSTPDF